MKLPTAKEVYLKVSDISTEPIDESSFMAIWERLTHREKELLYLNSIEKVSYDDINTYIKNIRPNVQYSIERIKKRNQ